MNKVIPIRASSLAGLFRCAYRYEGTYLLGMRLPASGAMVLGTAIHAGTAAFDNARLAGSPITPDEAAGAVVDKLNDPGEDVRRYDDDLSPKEAERIGIRVHTRYCAEISPRYEFRAVELDVGKLDVDVPEEGVTVELTGHLDRSRVVRGSKALRIADIKTGQRAATKDGRADVRGKGIQLSIYTLLAENVLHLPVEDVGEIIGLSTSTSGAVGVTEIASPKQQLLGGHGAPSLIEMAAHMMRTGLFYPNPNDILCSPRYCARWNSCVYHER